MLPSSPELEVESPQLDHEICDVCGAKGFEGGDDGFFYCSQCGSQSQNVVATEADAEDIFGSGCGVGAIYSVFHSRAKGRRRSSNPNCKRPSKEEILRSLTQSAADYPKKDSGESLCGFEDGSSSPQDFSSLGFRDLGRAVGETRLRYIQGLQLMLQLQCEALVEKFGVSALICGMAMSIWLRYVAISRVFDDGWVERMEDEAKTAIATKLMEKSSGKGKFPFHICFPCHLFLSSFI